MKFTDISSGLKKIQEEWGNNPDEIILDALEAGYDKDYEESIEILENGITVFSNKLDDTTKSRLWDLKARALQNLNRLDEALESIIEAIKIDEKATGLWLDKAEILHDLKNDSEALLAINNAINLAPKESKVDLGIVKAYYLSHLNKHDDALELYNDYLKKYPEDVDALLGKSEELFALGQVEDALKSIESALELEPDDIELLSQKGIVLLDRNKFEESLRCFEKCLEIDSSDELSWYNKACILSLLDKKEDALDALTVAISLDEENITWAKDEQDFDNIRDMKQFNRLTFQVI